MRFLRLILISFVLLFVVATVIGALLPSVVLVSRAVDIHASKDSIYPYLIDINEWKQWMEGMSDPSVSIHSPAKAKLGNSEVEIIGRTDSTVVSTWQPAKGSLQTATIRLIPSAGGKMTIVQWQFEQKLAWYPWEKLGSMMNDKILGTMMEKNLGNLKKLSEVR